MKDLIVACLVFLFCVGCVTNTKHSPTSVLAIESHPPHVDVFADGKFIGNTRDWVQGAVRIPAEVQRLEVRADGYYPLRRDVKFADNKTYTLRVELVIRPE